MVSLKTYYDGYCHYIIISLILYSHLCMNKLYKQMHAHTDSFKNISENTIKENVLGKINKIYMRGLLTVR